MTKKDWEEFLMQFRLKHQLDAKLKFIEEIKFRLASLEEEKRSLDFSVYEIIKAELEKDLEEKESDVDIMLYRSFEERLDELE